MTITELSIKRPILIIVIFLALTLLGVVGYSQLKYELFPNINIPTVSITTQYDGASASAVESLVTKKIEDAVSGVDKIDTITSTSQEGVSQVTVSFKQDANIDFALQDVQRKVNQILSALPDDVTSPSVSKVSLDDMPIIIAGFTSNLPDTQFYQLMDDFVKPSLSEVSGVGNVEVMGGNQRQIKVNIDRQKLQSYGLSVLQVLQAVQNANLEYPTGTVKDQDSQFVVRLSGRFETLDDLRELVVSRSEAGDILLSDVAEIQDGKAESVVITRINGKTTIGVMILKQSDANAVEVSKGVRKELAEIEKEYAKYNLKATVAMDNSTYTVDSANAVKEDLLFAILLVAGVMLVFLHSFRNSLIVMIAIPTSLVTTFTGMWALGFSLNIITLLALSLVIGILVDDAIVVLENIYRHLEKGEDKRSAALKGRNEIGFTALSITLVDVVVYLPLALVSGIIGGMIREFALVMVVSTLTSLFVSFTVTPLLASRFGKLEQLTKGTLIGRFGLMFERFYAALTKDYVAVLRASLKHPLLVLFLATVLFVAAVALVPMGFIGSEFMPQSDQGVLSIQLEMPMGTKLDQTNALTQTIERELSAMPEIESCFTAAGVGGQNNATANSAYFYVNLVPKKERKHSTEEVRQLLIKKFEKVPGIKLHITQAGLMGGGSSSPIQLAVSGPSWNRVMAAAEDVKKIAEQIPGTSDVRLSSEEGQPEMRIQIDRKKMARLGLDIATVGQTLRIAMAGDDNTNFQDRDGTEYAINVMLDEFNRSRTADLGELAVMNKSGQLVKLSQFASIVPSTGPTKVERRDRYYAITVSSQAIGRASGDIGRDIMQAVMKKGLPEGIKLAPVGTLKTMGESFASLGLALIAAIVFVYLIMAALYNSFIYPFAVLFSVPLAIIGALLALGLTQKSLAVFSIMGIIMLVGLVSKNAILLVDFANRAREEQGLGIHDALLEAGQERLRPILMTTLTMILGMLPLAFSAAVGSEYKTGLGWALIGGLTSSMFMTLVVVPVVYTKIEQVREFFMGLKDKLSRKPKAVYER
ncbi:HAE1 family hydrophobic/amphiphilic exporter-1 [Hydrogenispora ethanolica]|jgi:HAE1 family hydrophobic/amphiphilic exporter-1|uniref:HAE1 family hydrophobic/amphiphilic exporter-1 n=1 Tax=Hydrogenispora ethanolica TaxID=1082276 RepID=A0A4R1RY22_HYDET|nr:efflux RND transporter permease subunit [Hydrogenispora ethanolica]TCL71596.1 HAE1 family hydrophobic/amphiphilic exporter-1 [Hydrogenispora ethanolica]